MKRKELIILWFLLPVAIIIFCFARTYFWTTFYAKKLFDFIYDEDYYARKDYEKEQIEKLDKGTNNDR